MVERARARGESRTPRAVVKLPHPSVRPSMPPPPPGPLNAYQCLTAATDRGQTAAAQDPSALYCYECYGDYDEDKLAWRARMLDHSCPRSLDVRTSQPNHSMNSPWSSAFNPHRRQGSKHCLSAGSMEKHSKLGRIPENDMKKFGGNYQAVYNRIFTNSMNNLFKTVDSELRAREIKNNVIRLNIVRGKSVMTASIVTAQLAARHHTYFYAYFVSLISKDFPEIGDLVIRRCIKQFRISFTENDRDKKMASIQFISHLINLRVVSQILAVSLLKTVIQKPAEDAAEAILIVIHTCKKTLCRQSKKKLYEFLDTLPNSPVYRLSLRDQVEGYVKEKIKINNYFTKGCKLKRSTYTSKIPYFNIHFEDSIHSKDSLISYHYEEEFENTERMYELFRKQILNTGNEDEYVLMYDNNGRGMLTTTKSLKRFICSSLQYPSMFDYEMCALQLMNLKLNPGAEFEICLMILEICSERNVFDENLGHITQIICQLNRLLIKCFVKLFVDIYTIVNRHYDEIQIQNFAKFYAHLFYTETISLTALSTICLDEIDITSSTGLFVKTLFVELVDLMAEDELRETVLYPSLKNEFAEIVFGKYEKSFSVNFCRSIGLNDSELTNFETF